MLRSDGHRFDPDPTGKRGRLPPGSPCAIAGAGAGERFILVALSSAIERYLFTEAFHQLRWRVESTPRLLESLYDESCPVGPDVVLTDTPEEIEPTRELLPSADYVALVDPDQRAIDGAYKLGADWVVTRPIDPSDPLGFDLSGPDGPR